MTTQDTWTVLVTNSINGDLSYMELVSPCNTVGQHRAGLFVLLLVFNFC